MALSNCFLFGVFKHLGYSPSNLVFAQHFYFFLKQVLYFEKLSLGTALQVLIQSLYLCPLGRVDEGPAVTSTLTGHFCGGFITAVKTDSRLKPDFRVPQTRSV